MRSMYRMLDDPAASKAAIEIQPSEAPQWNSKGFGIFQTVNEFNGPRRIENLKRICSWAVDIDDGPKTSQAELLMRGPLLPSRVVETKRGYQAYWNATAALAAHWNAIVVDRLVPYYGADRNARDLARILRAPGYLHLKDPADPFLCKEVWSHEVAYTEEQIVKRYPLSQEAKKIAELHERPKREVKFKDSDGFWDRVGSLDCEEALARLSGHSCVGGEQYTFRQTSSGNRNIYVDGKGTSCWIDHNGRIGSNDKGGPVISAWLRWYGLGWPEVAKVLKELFPQLEQRS